MRGQIFAQISQQFLERRPLLDLKEVLVEISVSQVVKSEIAGQVFGKKKFFCGANLVEELSQDFIVFEHFGNLVAFDWETLVRTEGKLLHNS